MTAAHEIAQALEAAYEKGVLHRDLKPGNIRMGLDGRVKLLDFGLARVVRDVGLDSQLATRTASPSPATVEGTAPYMSPEQARGQDVDHRSDVWAFGCVFFELLTGKRAFGGATFSDTVAAILDHEPDWKAMPPATPPAVLKLLQRCLQKEKHKRLCDIGDARLEMEDILAAPASTGDDVPRSGHRVPWPAISALAALLAAIALWVRPSSDVPREAIWLSLEGPAEGQLGPPVLSPTGDRVVYATFSGLVVRELGKPDG